MLDFLKGKIKLKKEYVAVIILSVIAIFLLFYTSGSKSDSSQNDTQAFISQTEEKLKKSIEKIDGVKRATVSITVNNGIQTIIAQDVKEIEENGKKTITSSPVLVGGKPIILGETYPEIVGVVVICSCTDSMTVRMSVLDVVTTMLDVPCERVRILTQ